MTIKKKNLQWSPFEIANVPHCIFTRICLQKQFANGLHWHTLCRCFREQMASWIGKCEFIVPTTFESMLPVAKKATNMIGKLCTVNQRAHCTSALVRSHL